jgi:hypothetical protein
MKIKTRYLIIIFPFVFMGLATASGLAQKEGQVKSESKKVIISVSELGKKIGVKQEETFMPDGKMGIAQKWGKAEIQKAVAELKRCYNDPESTYLVTSSPHPAITLAFIQALQPLHVLYLYMEPGGDEVEMCELKKAKQIPAPDSNYGVRFEMIEDGGKLFINFNSDSAEATALKQHSFDIKNICKLAIPEIPAGKHVFLHARGRYCVMVTLAYNYIRGAKSISIARHEDDYTCAVSFSDEIEIGEVTARTLQNNL